jgi:hypothetical protein
MSFGGWLRGSKSGGSFERSVFRRFRGAHALWIVCVAVTACVDSREGKGALDSSAGGMEAAAGSSPGAEAEGFECLDASPDEAAASSGEYTVSFFLRDSVTLAPKGGVKARPCRRLDSECTSPMGDGATNADGRVAMSLPAGFDGYIQFEGNEIATTLYFFDPPVSADVPELLISVSSPATTAGIVQLTGATPDRDRGFVLLSTYDCKGAAAAGVTITSGAVGDAAKLFYVRNGLPDTTMTATDETGYAGVVNAAPGAASFTATIGDRTIGSVTVQVKAGAQTLARITPGGT